MELITSPIAWTNLIPALAYLALVSALVATGRIWHPVHAVALVIGAGARLALEGPVALIGLIAGALVFIIATWAFYRTLSATAIFTIATAVALTPLNALWGVILGVIAGAAVGLARTSRARSKQHLINAALATGITPYGPGQVNLSFMPQRKDARDQRRLALPPFILGGVALTALSLALGA